MDILLKISEFASLSITCENRFSPLPGARFFDSYSPRPRDLLPTKEDYLARGFQKIHDDLAFLMNCFREVLQELGEQHLADNLPWINQVRIDPTPNPRLCQAYSIAFQFLNMVEENVAAQIRRARESETGLAGEPGLWADQLRKLRQSGISESTIAA